LTEKWVKFMHCCQIQYNFKCISHTFLPLTFAKLSTLKIVHLWPTLYSIHYAQTYRKGTTDSINYIIPYRISTVSKAFFEAGRGITAEAMKAGKKVRLRQRQPA